MPLYRPQSDGTVKVWWRNAKAKQLLGEHIAVVAHSDQPHHIAEATAELDQLVAEFKHKQGLVMQRAKVLADAAETEHLPETSLRRLASELCKEAYEHVGEKRKRDLWLMVSRFERWKRGDVDVRQITYQDKMHYREEVCRQWNEDWINGQGHYKPPGEHGCFAQLGTLAEVLKLGKRLQLVSDLPANLPSPPKRKKRLILDESMLSVVCREMQKRQTTGHVNLICEALAWFEFHTAVRSTEAVSLQWRDIDPKADDGLGTITFFDTKNSEHHVLPLFPQVKRILEQLKALDLPRPFPVSAQQYRKAFQDAREAAFASGSLLVPEEQLWEVTPHIMRHTAITNMANSGTNAFAVQAFANHKSRQTTDGYMHGNKATRDLIRAANSAVNESSVRSLTTR